MESQAIVIIGTPMDWTAFGPFENKAEATSWAETEATKDPWWVVELSTP